MTYEATSQQENVPRETSRAFQDDCFPLGRTYLRPNPKALAAILFCSTWNIKTVLTPNIPVPLNFKKRQEDRRLAAEDNAETLFHVEQRGPRLPDRFKTAPSFSPNLYDRHARFPFPSKTKTNDGLPRIILMSNRSPKPLGGLACLLKFFSDSFRSPPSTRHSFINSISRKGRRSLSDKTPKIFQRGFHSFFLRPRPNPTGREKKNAPEKTRRDFQGVLLVPHPP